MLLANSYVVLSVGDWVIQLQILNFEKSAVEKIYWIEEMGDGNLRQIIKHIYVNLNNSSNLSEETKRGSRTQLTRN